MKNINVFVWKVRKSFAVDYVRDSFDDGAVYMIQDMRGAQEDYNVHC